MSGLVLILVYPIAAAWNGAVLSVLWGWFMVPLGLPPLTLIGAIGVQLVIFHLTSKPAPKDEDSDLARTLVYAAVQPVIALAFGFFWQLFR